MIDIDYINKVEKRYPVSKWSACGFYIWPILRIIITTQVLLRSSEGTSDTSNMHEKISRVVKGNIDFLVSKIKDKEKNQKINKADYMFLSNPNCKTLINGYWYDKFCDPIREELYERGYCSLYMENTYSYRIPRYNTGIFLQPKLDCFKIRSRLFLDKSIVREWEGFSEMQKELEHDWGIKISSKQVLSCVRYVDLLSSWFSNIIKKAQVKAAFMICYYSLEGMALCLACKKQCIPSIDIQHGVQGTGHRAYSRWSILPPQGYELLPSVFWCWSEYEAEIISDWGKKAGNQHKAIVAGNPWLEKYQALIKNDSYRDEKTKLCKIIADKQKILLICLSGVPSFGVGLDQFLLDIMKSSDPSFLWLVRMHPREIQYKEKIVTQLKEQGITNYEIELSTKLPLQLILEHTNVHLTHWSTTALEAAAYNIPTIFLDKKGPEVFKEQLPSDLLYYADDNKSLQNALDNAKNKVKKFGKPIDNLKKGLSILEGMNILPKNTN